MNREPFKPEHLDDFEPRVVQKGEFSAGKSTKAWVSLRHENRTLAVFGGIFVGTSSLQVWALISDSITENPLGFHKLVLSEIDRAQKAFNLKRIQIEVRKSFKMGQKWATSLGFECEGLLRQAAPDREDCYLYGRVFP